MDDFDAELERRLTMLEDPDSGEAVLAALPVRDLLAATGALVLLSVLLWWAL